TRWPRDWSSDVCSSDLGQRVFGSTTGRTASRCVEGIRTRLPPRKIQYLHRLIGAKTMAEVTYYVALPFVATDDGVATGEPTECRSEERRVGTEERCGGA